MSEAFIKRVKEVNKFSDITEIGVRCLVTPKTVKEWLSGTMPKKSSLAVLNRVLKRMQIEHKEHGK